MSMVGLDNLDGAHMLMDYGSGVSTCGLSAFQTRGDDW